MNKKLMAFVINDDEAYLPFDLNGVSLSSWKGSHKLQ